MHNIDEFEKRLISQGMTDEAFSQYQELLKRVNGNFLKRQHCYATAVQFPKKHAEEAIRLIQYGLNTFEDEWFSTYMSYLSMGHIYERAGNYQKAYESYLLAKGALPSEENAYIHELSKNLMWMKLHVDFFEYSEELESYFSCFEKANDFSKSFINAEFKVAVVGVVLCMHRNQTDEARQFLERARAICRPNYVGKLKNMLARHRYVESLNATPESLTFIKNLKL